ncbi:MAG: AAA family ATPase, partial [Lachnospiraceae bacterium]|nr:AAA family ATPase [Lachnospiraceae bacterium]
MRPIHLSISAFGSFHGKTEIPFDELGEKGMFLIWGKTGSGKTTIFDALCYALYGKTSGETRTDKMIRSDRAEISRMTEVELTFQYGGKIYRILRSPDQMRPKARGQGETISRKSVTLTCPEGRQLRGDEAERHILELLGLDYNQFRQIALIAQGEFRRLLFADSNKRKEIYRRVFYTENYFRLQEALKNDLSQLENQARGKRERMAQFLEGLKVKEDSPLLSEAQLAKDSRLLTPETLELLQGLLKEDEARESLNLSRGRKLKEEADTLRDRLSKAEEQKKAKAAREEALWVIEEAREPLRQAGEQWEQEKARREETKKVENRLVELRRELADFAALQEEQKNSEGLLQQIRQQEEELGALQRELNRCLREEAQAQEALSALE